MKKTKLMLTHYFTVSYSSPSALSHNPFSISNMQCWHCFQNNRWFVYFTTQSIGGLSSETIVLRLSCTHEILCSLYPENMFIVTKLRGWKSRTIDATPQLKKKPKTSYLVSRLRLSYLWLLLAIFTLCCLKELCEVHCLLSTWKLNRSLFA